MLQGLQVNSTNAVNLYGSRFTVRALLDGVWRTCDLGIPTYIAHDRSRLIGWAIPLTLHFEPGMVRSLHIQQIVETPEEQENLNHLVDAFYTKLYSEKRESISELKESLNPYLKGGGQFNHIPAIALRGAQFGGQGFP